MGSLSFIISVVILLICVVTQFVSFFETQKKRNEYKNIFPQFPELTFNFIPQTSIEEDTSDGGESRIDLNENSKISPVMKEIVNAINNYLGKNRNATDFAIIKDISDRNSDSVHSQIESASPIPVYIGLCGTLIGIVIGVAVLAFGHGLSNLFNVDLSTDAASSGIVNLLQGIGVAMLSTFSGVLLSIIGSYNFTIAQAQNEDKKNRFFSWVQAEMLPKMDNGIANTLDVLERNLNKFNAEFSHNSQSLTNIIGQVNDAAKSQVKLYQLIKELDIEKMATANTMVWRELSGSSEQLKEVHKFLFNSQQYLTRVKELNDQLDASDRRTMLIEEMGQFFKNEIQEIEQRKAAMNKAVGEVDEAIVQGLDELKKNTRNNFLTFIRTSSEENDKLSRAIQDQEKILSEKTEEIGNLIEELHQLTEVKEALSQEKEALDKLTILAEVQNKNSATQNDLLRQFLQIERSSAGREKVTDVPVTCERTSSDIHVHTPGWLKLLGIIICTFVVLIFVFIVLEKFNVL